MPRDRPKVNGPDETSPYSIYVDPNTKLDKSTIKCELQTRRDSRRHDELREAFIKLGGDSQAKGSAYVELGQTKVICSVFVLKKIPNRTDCNNQRKLHCELKFSNLSCPRRKGYQQYEQEEQYSLLMQRSLEPAVCKDEFPQVEVFAFVLNNDGSVLSAAIMAASLALENANVPMYGIVSAVTAGIYDDLVILDPTDCEESLCMITTKNSEPINHGIVMQAMMSQHNQTSALFLFGTLDTNFVSSITDKLNKAGKEMYFLLVHRIIRSMVTLEFLKRKKRGEGKEELHKI